MRMDILSKLIDIVPDGDCGWFKIVLQVNGAKIEFPGRSLMAAMPDDQARQLIADWMDAARKHSAPRETIKSLPGTPTRLQNELSHYINSVFEKTGIEISNTQKAEMRKVFFAGALVTLGHFATATQQSREDGAKMINELMTEAMAVGNEIAVQTKDLN